MAAKILNVAEKNDAAKALSNIMSGGRARKVGKGGTSRCSLAHGYLQLHLS